VPLPEPTTDAGRSGLAAILGDVGSALLGLDFDGTLSPIVDRPQEARALPGVADVVSALADRLGAVAIVTGRPVNQLFELIELPSHGRLVVLGQYGAERWDATSQQVVQTPIPDGVDDVRRKLPAVLAELNSPEGTEIEDKGRALAVHTRGTADPEGTLKRLTGPLLALAERHGLALEPGRLVLELRPPGRDKGAALTEVVAEVGAKAVAYVGDDLGDLAAYDAVDALRITGTPGLLVCSASDEVTALADRADVVVPGPPGVLEFLEALSRAVQ
jgi:trehalose 6-phosphate phosphatase